MNILVTIDDNYFEPLRVMIYSLLKNNSHRKINIYLLYQNISKKHLQILKQTVEKSKGSFFSIYAGIDPFVNAPRRTHITNTTYLRLLAPMMLPMNINKILYLDADTIIDGKLDKLYDLDMKQYYFAAPQDYLETSDYNFHKKSIGMPVNYTYICAGILLMNIQELRKHLDLSIVYKLINEKGSKLTMQDQDIINILFYDKIKVISSIYGKEAWILKIENKLKLFLNILLHKEEKPIIIHYLYEYKPWKEKYIGRYMKTYWKYAKAFKKHKNYKIIKKNYNSRFLSEIKGYLDITD